MQWTMVYDTITGVYIDRVPLQLAKSCTKKSPPEKHVWVLNTAHHKVCINCGMVGRVTSFYEFALEAGASSAQVLGVSLDCSDARGAVASSIPLRNSNSIGRSPILHCLQG